MIVSAQNIKIVLLLVIMSCSCQNITEKIPQNPLNVLIFKQTYIYYHVINYFKISPKWQIVNNSSTNQTIDYYWFQRRFAHFLKNFKKSDNFIDNIWIQRYILYNKASIHQLIRTYQQFQRKYNPNFVQLKVLPETHLIQYNKDALTQSENSLMRDSQKYKLWIVKPLEGRLGQGIFLVKNASQLLIPKLMKLKKKVSYKENLQFQTLKKQLRIMQNSYIVQEYISRPLLIEQKKFDMRGYLYIASFNPFLVLYVNGYIKRSMKVYDSSNINDLSIHLTNNSYQKKLKQYLKEGHTTLWSIEKFQNYLRDNNKLKNVQIETIFNRLYSKLAYLMSSVYHNIQNVKKQRNKQQFQRLYQNLEHTSCLYGPDIVFDSNYEPYLLEMNLAPMIHYTQKSISPQIKKMIQYFMDVQADVINNKQNLWDFLKNLKQSDLPDDLIILHNEAANFKFHKGNQQIQNQGQEVSELWKAIYRQQQIIVQDTNITKKQQEIKKYIIHNPAITALKQKLNQQNFAELKKMNESNQQSSQNKNFNYQSQDSSHDILNLLQQQTLLSQQYQKSQQPQQSEQQSQNHAQQPIQNIKQDINLHQGNKLEQDQQQNEQKIVKQYKIKGKTGNGQKKKIQLTNLPYKKQKQVIRQNIVPNYYKVSDLYKLKQLFLKNKQIAKKIVNTSKQNQQNRHQDL